MKVAIFFAFGLKTLIHAPQNRDLADLTPKWGAAALRPPKRISLCRGTSYAAWSLRSVNSFFAQFTLFTQLSKSYALQYFSVGQTPSKSRLHVLAFRPHLIHASLHPPKSTSQTASRLVQPFLHSLWQSVPIVYNKKVKAPHTRHRALGPELIPVYRQSARRWL